MAMSAIEKQDKHDRAMQAAARAARAAGQGEVAGLILSGAIRVWRRSSGSGQWQFSDVRKLAPHSLAIVFVDDLGESPPEFYVVPVTVISDIALQQLRQGGDQPHTPDSGHGAMSPGDGRLDTGWLETYRNRWDFWRLWDGAGWPPIAPRTA